MSLNLAVTSLFLLLTLKSPLWDERWCINFCYNLIEFKGTLVLAPNGDKVIWKYNNIKIDTRKVTALKGVTEVRKTTLIRALLRYYPSNTDNILVFWKPFSQYSYKELTDKIYYVTQN